MLSSFTCSSTSTLTLSSRHDIQYFLIGVLLWLHLMHAGETGGVELETDFMSQKNLTNFCVTLCSIVKLRIQVDSNSRPGLVSCIILPSHRVFRRLLLAIPPLFPRCPSTLAPLRIFSLMPAESPSEPRQPGGGTGRRGLGPPTRMRDRLSGQPGSRRSPTSRCPGPTWPAVLLGAAEPI